MSEKYRDYHCLTFYHGYDRFMKTFLEHVTFFNFIRERMQKAKEDQPCHKILISVFFDYFNSHIIEGNTNATRHLEKTKGSIKSIVDYCYVRHFKVDKASDNIIELKKAILQKDECHKFLQWSKNYQQEHKLNEADILAATEIDFIYALSTFMFSKRKTESASYFNRFLFIYPTKKESNVNDKQVRDWKENHTKFFEPIKQDKNASKEDLEKSRKWYKELVEKTDFNEFSEEDLSLFFKEALVAFGNKISEKKGCFVGYVTPLKNLLYIGRYYNIIGLSPKYLQWEKGSPEEKTLSLIAHATWRQFLDLNLVYDSEKIRQKAKENRGRAALDEDLFDKKARRFDINELKKQDSYGEIITPSNKQDLDVFENVINQISLSKVLELKQSGASREEIMETIIPDILIKSGISNFIRGTKKEDLAQLFDKFGKKDYSEMPLQSYRAMFILPTAKATPIQTSYDIYKAIQETYNGLDQLSIVKNILAKLVE